jgi:uncharacterized protein (TIGR03382 family)
MAASTMVDNTLTFTPGESASSDIHIGTDPNQFQFRNSGYMAFVFNLVTDGPSYYGWARVTLNNSSTDPGVIHEWAYEDTPGAAIMVGTFTAIPEPPAASFILLAGALLARRRRV